MSEEHFELAAMSCVSKTPCTLEKGAQRCSRILFVGWNVDLANKQTLQNMKRTTRGISVHTAKVLQGLGEYSSFMINPLHPSVLVTLRPLPSGNTLPSTLEYEVRSAITV